MRIVSIKLLSLTDYGRRRIVAGSYLRQKHVASILYCLHRVSQFHDLHIYYVGMQSPISLAYILLVLFLLVR